MNYRRGSYLHLVALAAFAVISAGSPAYAAPKRKLTQEQKDIRGLKTRVSGLETQNGLRITSQSSLNDELGKQGGRLTIVEQRQGETTQSLQSLTREHDNLDTRVDTLATDLQTLLNNPVSGIDGRIQTSINSGAIKQALDGVNAARVNSFNTLDSRITSTNAAQSSALTAAINAEVTRSNNQISASATSLQNALNAGDTALNARVGAEESARAAAISSLTNRIGAEEVARAARDTAIEARIQTEENTRAAGDQTLANQILAERTARESAISAESNARNSQIAARETAIRNDLTGAINTSASTINARVTQVILDAGDQVVAERVARTSAINALNATVSANDAQIRADLIQDYGLPKNIIPVSAATPNGGSAVAASDYYCQVINLAGYLDGVDRSARVALTLHKNSVSAVNGPLLDVAEMRTADVLLNLEDPALSRRASSDARRSVSVVASGSGVFSRNIKATSEHFSWLLGANGATLATFQGAALGNASIGMGSNSWAANREWGVEIRDAANTVVGLLTNGVPLKPGTSNAAVIANFGCANVSLADSERLAMMADTAVFKDPLTFAVQVRGDYLAKVIVSD